MSKSTNITIRRLQIENNRLLEKNKNLKKKLLHTKALLYYKRGEFYEVKIQEQKAEEWFKRAIKSDPKYS